MVETIGTVKKYTKKQVEVIFESSVHLYKSETVQIGRSVID